MKISVKTSMNIISMIFTFMVCAAVPKTILADIPLGDQHCGDPKCIGKFKYHKKPRLRHS